MKRWLSQFTPWTATIFLIGLITAAFCLVLYKDSPSGSDAYIYVHEAMWIQDHDQLTTPYQSTYAGADAYVSPITALNLFLISEGSGQPIDYPVTTFYQIAVIVLFVTSLCLVALTTKSLRVVLLVLIGLLGNYGLYLLNIAVTISNLLAFVLINNIVLTVWWMRQRVGWCQITLLTGQIIALLLLHRYLSAPIFLFVLTLYGCGVMAASQVARARLKTILQKNPWLRWGWPILALVCIGLLYFIFREPLYELNRSFIEGLAPSGARRFNISHYKTFIGLPLFWFGVVGFIVFPLWLRQYWKQFGVLWLLTLVLLCLPLLQFIGVDFYFDRTTMLAIPYLALFAGLFLDSVFAQLPVQLQRYTTVGFFLVVLVTGIQTNQFIYNSSNYVTPEHAAAYRFLNTVSQPDEIILSNTNFLSETHHDKLLSHRIIKALSLDKAMADQIVFDDFRQGIILRPNNRVNQKKLREAHIQFILFDKRFARDQGDLRSVLTQYRKSTHFKMLFKNEAIEIFQLATAAR